MVRRSTTADEMHHVQEILQAAVLICGCDTAVELRDGGQVRGRLHKAEADAHPTDYALGGTLTLETVDDPNVTVDIMAVDRIRAVPAGTA